MLIRRADVAAALVLGSVVVQAFFVDRVPALILPGEVRVYVTDVVVSLVVGAAVLRLLRTRRFDRYQRWLLLLGVLLLVSLVRGVAAFGMQQSVNELRHYLFFAGVALYFATFPVSVGLYDRIGRIWLAVSIPMMVLVSVRWLAVFAGIDLGVPAEKFGADAAIRVIDGPFTFFLASAFVLTIPAWLRGEQATLGPPDQRPAAAVRAAAQPPDRLAGDRRSGSPSSCCATGGSAAVRSCSSLSAP